MAVPKWAYLPTNALDAAQRESDATDWANEQRTRLADEWATQQHRLLQEHLDMIKAARAQRPKLADYQQTQPTRQLGQGLERTQPPGLTAPLNPLGQAPVQSPQQGDLNPGQELLRQGLRDSRQNLAALGQAPLGTAATRLLGMNPGAIADEALKLQDQATAPISGAATAFANAGVPKMGLPGEKTTPMPAPGQGLGEWYNQQRAAGNPVVPLGDVPMMAGPGELAAPLRGLPGELRAVPRLVGQAAEDTSKVIQAADRFITKPETQAAIKRILPAASIENVGEGANVSRAQRIATAAQEGAERAAARRIGSADIQGNISEPIPPPLPTRPIDEVAQNAIAKRFAAVQNLDQRANTLQQWVKKGVQSDQETRLFRDAIEHPENIESNASKVKDGKAFRHAASEYQKFTDYAYQELGKQGARTGYLEDYYSHIIDLSKPEDKARFDALMQAKNRNFSGYYNRQRVFKDINELEQAGFKLKNRTVNEDIAAFTGAVKKELGGRTLANEMNRGAPGSAFTVNKDVADVPAGFTQSRIPGLKGTYFSPEAQNQLEPLERWKGNRVLNAVDAGNRILKQVELGAGFFHATQETLRYVGNELANLRMPDLFHATQMFYSPNAMLKYKQAAIETGLLDKASSMGVTIGRMADLGDFTENGISAIANSKSPIKMMERATFDRLINFYKLETVRHVKLEKMTALEAQRVGAQINDLFGGLNYDILRRSKATQQLLRLGLLAPDFNEGKMRTLAGAIATPELFKARSLRAVGAALKGDAGTAFARRALIGHVLAVGISAEVGNLLITGHFSSLQNVLSEAVLDPRFPLPFTNASGGAQEAALPSTDISDVARAVQDPLHFVESRGGALVSTTAQIGSGKDFYGRKVTPLGIATSHLPIPAAQLTDILSGKSSVPAALINTAGGRVITARGAPKRAASPALLNYLGTTRKRAAAKKKNASPALQHYLSVR